MKLDFKNLRFLFLFLAFSFLFVIIFSIYFRSSDRASLFSSNGNEEIKSEVSLISELEKEIESRIHLQDFHRVEVKEGRTVWEITAREARYFQEEQTTHVKDAFLIVYREGGSTVKVNSDTAILYQLEGDLDKADLEGNILVRIENNTKIKTDTAQYFAGQGKITSSDLVVVEGEGYVIEGKGFEIFVDTQDVKLEKSVSSEFFQVDNLVFRD